MTPYSVHDRHDLRRSRAQFNHGVGLVRAAENRKFRVDRRDLVTWCRRSGVHRRGVAPGTGLASLAADGRGGSRRILVPAAGHSHCHDAPAPQLTIHAIAICMNQWGNDAARRMFWFLQSQAAVGIILALSIVLAAHNPNPNLRLQDLIGLAILLAAIVGEAIADRQLRAFKSDPANRNAICDVGLWRWSRHPNYFFEWLFWLAYPIIAIDFAGHNPYGWLSLAAPICMYWILVHVSGIPPLEDHMLRSRGEAFRAYQKRTRAFLPLPSK